MILRLILALLLTSFVASGCATAQEGTSPRDLVQTEAGPVRGTIGGDYRRFLGVPYAAPPTGDRRWKVPQPAASWSAPLDATAETRCPQTSDIPGSIASSNEDCLYLNVYTPRAAGQGTPLPVMVWLHGGGFSAGAGSDYDARRLAVGGNVIVITVNYRLGIFGFFAHKGLDGGGNFGILDQIEALHWVRRNAAHFGGDPNNVTLFGESAGGMSTCALLTSPEAEGLFERAIVQSGACLLEWPPNSWFPGVPSFTPYAALSNMEARGSIAADALGCKSAQNPVACLRAKPASDLLEQNRLFTQVAYGTSILPESPAIALRKSDVIQVPVMIGGTRDEHRSLIAGMHRRDPITEESYASRLADIFGPRAAAVEKEYALLRYAVPPLALSAAISDDGWACPTLATARLLSSNVPTYVYEFADEDAPNPGYEPPEGFKIGPAHATELAYLFDLNGELADFRPDQRELADAMIGYWSRFAATGNPNGHALQHWPPFSADGESALMLAPGADGIRPIDLAAQHKCEFWQDAAATSAIE